MLEPNDTWKIIDASKLKTYMTCPRMYLYKYVLGWRPEGDNIHLIFGESWHRAMESLLIYGYSQDSVKLAFLEFQKYYRRFYSQESDDIHFPKNPQFASMMLDRYVKKWATDHDQFMVLDTEIGGQVMLAEDRPLAFRVDAICKGIGNYYQGKVFILEHKTTKSTKGAWQSSWTLSTQLRLYNHVLRCTQNRSDIYGTIINGAQFQKTDPNFIRLVFKDNEERMAVWYYNLLHYYDLLDEDMYSLTKSESFDASILTSFVLNTESCTTWNRLCEYHDLCSNWMNPLEHVDYCPQGFVVDFWNPLDRELKKRLDIS